MCHLASNATVNLQQRNFPSECNVLEYLRVIQALFMRYKRHKNVKKK